MNWQIVHYLGYFAGLFLALEPSYIHPDEHFQSIEVLSSLWGYSVHTPWEFTVDNPVRSWAILLIVYYPSMLLGKLFNGLNLLYVVRLQMYVVSFVVTKIAMQLLVTNKQHRSRAEFFISTSWVTWTVQNHTFSNSIETWFLLIVLALFNVLIIDSAYKHYKTSMVLGVCIALGVFNRVTFLAFIMLPSMYVAWKFYKHRIDSFGLLVLGFLSASAVCVYIDSKMYGHLVIAPWNLLAYNTQTENLAQHGIHPRVTHLLANMPQLVGPILLPLLWNIKRCNNAVAGLAVVSGLAVLSLIPHQELRFLIPLSPLCCILVDFSHWKFPYMDALMKVWLVFNIAMGVIMGLLHQRGVLVTLGYLGEIDYQGTMTWWKTYSPPTWPLHSITDSTIDLKGCDVDELVAKLKPGLLITPTAMAGSISSVNITSGFKFTQFWHYKYHLDLDRNPLTLGIDVYEVSLL